MQDKLLSWPPTLSFALQWPPTFLIPESPLGDDTVPSRQEITRSLHAPGQVA